MLAAAFAADAPRAAAQSTTLKPAERGALARQFVGKWGGYAQRMYDVPVGGWAARMVPTFVAADSTNLRRSLQRETFEGCLLYTSRRG